MSSEEKVVRFGPDAGLVGILSEPAVDSRNAARPAVLFWNVGINHRVGPYRIYVDLARRLAALGFVSLRFDISGLGDSDFSKDDARTDSERSIGDIRDAMDLIEKQLGIREFVVIGFCSSVDHAHATALVDPRVIGVVYIEGYSFRARGYYLRYPLRLLDANRWARQVLRRAPHLFGREQAQLESAETVFVRESPTPHRLRTEFRMLVERRVRLLFMYVAGDSYYAHRDQIFEFLRDPRLKGRVEVSFWPDADHTFSLVRDRERAVERVCRFMRMHFDKP